MKTILSVLLCFGFVFCKGQVKIGNITLDNKTAKEYFLDCYLHPDTVIYHKTYTNICGCWMAINAPTTDDFKMQYESYVAKANEWNEYVDKNKIGEAFGDNKCLLPRKPSEEDFIKWFNKHKTVN